MCFKLSAGEDDDGYVPGIWSAYVQSTAQDQSFGTQCLVQASSSLCPPVWALRVGVLVQVRTQSNIALFYGFTNSPSSDAPATEPIYRQSKAYPMISSE